MQVNPDFSEASTFSMPDPGHYVAKVSKAEPSESESGSKFIKWTLEIVKADSKAQIGRTIWHNTPIGGKYAWILMQFLQAVDDSYSGGPFKTEEFLNKKLEIDVVRRPESKYAEVRNPAPFIETGSVASSVLSGNNSSGETASDVPDYESDNPFGG